MIFPFGRDALDEVRVFSEQSVGEALPALFGDREVVARHAHVGPCCLREPRFGPRHALPAVTHQFNVRPRKLALGLLPVAAVGPQKGLVGRDDEFAERARKAREVLDKLPALGHVFGQMGIGGDGKPGGKVVFAHEGAQTREALGNGRRHGVNFSQKLRRKRKGRSRRTVGCRPIVVLPPSLGSAARGRRVKRFRKA